MARADFPIVGSLYEDLITKINSEKTINMYEVMSEQTEKKTYLHPWPGKKFTVTFGDTVARGRAAFVFRDFAYFVEGETIYRMDSTLVPTVIALNFFTTTTTYVAISANEFQIVFVDGQKCFLWDTNTSTGIDNTPNLPTGIAPLSIIFMDGYFILITTTAGQQNAFFISALNDGTSWSNLDFALINSRPTILNGVAVLKRRVFFFGQTKSEIWEDAGEADFPFRRNNNLLFEHGVKAIGSISEGFDYLFYLSADVDGVGSIKMVDGVSPKTISTRQIDEEIQTFATAEDAVGFVFKINGQIFYQISFTGDNKTFVYNVNTDKWHLLETLNHNRDTSNTHIFFLNKHFITTYNDDNIYELSRNFFMNDSEKIRKTRIMRPLPIPTYERIKYNRIQIDMLMGVGVINTKPLSAYPTPPVPLAAGDVDPQIFLYLSEDGGVTYDLLGQMSFGQAGDRLIRVLWHAIGFYRFAIAKFEMYSSVPTYILGGAVDFEQEPQ